MTTMRNPSFLGVGPGPMGNYKRCLLGSDQSWQLVRRRPEGEESVLARHVLAFDLLADGRVVYSNGGAICLVSRTELPALLTTLEHTLGLTTTEPAPFPGPV